MGSVVESVRCGNRYQEATATSGNLGLCYVCNSLGAIGLCADCHRPVDGVHGVIGNAGILCPECQQHRREAASAERAIQAETDQREAQDKIATMPTVEYLREVAIRRIPVSTRPAKGIEIAQALGLKQGSQFSYDGRGGISIGQFEPGVDRVLRVDGSLDAVKRSGWFGKERRVNEASHVYSPEQATKLLQEGREYIGSINRPPTTT